MSTIVGRIDTTAFEGDGLEIVGTDDFDRLSGEPESDLIDAGAGDDFVFGEGGDDSILGREGNDTILSGEGADIIEAGAGDDLIFGEFGDDYINGAEGNDTVVGGEGVDTLAGGEGSDLLFGGEGADVFEFNLEDFASGEVDTIGDFQIEEDTIAFTGLSEGDELTFTSNGISVNGNQIINIIAAEETSTPSEEEGDSGFDLV